MLDCIPFMHGQYFFDHYTSSVNLPPLHKITCGLCSQTTWRFDTNNYVYMFLIDLLNDNHTQHGLNAIVELPKLNLEQKNHSFGIFIAVLSLIVVAGRYNESRSTIFRLVERVNVIGTDTDRRRSG